MKRQLAAFMVGLSLLVARRPSFAQSPAVNVASEGCDAALAPEVRRIAAIELRASAAPPFVAPPTTIRLTCRLRAVDVEVVGDTTQRPLRRSVTLDGVPAGGIARLLALAAAELVLALWESREPAESASAPAAPTAPPLPVVPARVSSPKDIPPVAMGPQPEPLFHTPRVYATLDARTFTQGAPMLLGGGMAAESSVGSHLVLDLDVQGQYGESSRGLGDVAVTDVDGALGIGWRWRYRWIETTAFVRARVGYASLSGTATSKLAAARSVQGVWLGPEAFVLATFRPSPRLRPFVGLAVGDAALGVQATVENGSSVSLLGLALELSIGIGFGG